MVKQVHRSVKRNEFEACFEIHMRTDQNVKRFKLVLQPTHKRISVANPTVGTKYASVVKGKTHRS